MSDPKPFASLSPTLLARKGAAKPAMRPQIQPLQQFHDNAARQMEDDLGWNDMGDPHPEEAQVVAINGQDFPANDEPAEKPEVVRQLESIVHSIARPVACEPAKPELVPLKSVHREPVQREPSRVSALDQGRRAAFTLRLDGDRHLKLRLASTLSNRSAQQLVTEALDRLLEGMPDVASLATRVRKQR